MIRVKVGGKAVITMLAMILIVLLSSGAVSAEYVLVNSKDWQDVYSGVQYAKLNKMDSRFVLSERFALDLPPVLKKNEQYILIQGRENYANGFLGILRGQGLSVSNLEYNTSVNIDLATKLYNSGVRKFILVDGRTGYDALSAAPYAVKSNSYVIFADPVTIDDVDNFFSEHPPENIILFGNLRREILDSMEKYNPEILNEGNRFDNNLAMVDKFVKIEKPEQILISNGEFIEDELMLGNNPVVFIGVGNIPDQTKKYVKDAGFNFSVIVGNNLIKTGTQVKRELGLNVFIKFAKSTVSDGKTPHFQDLEAFPVPKYEMAVDIEQARYNLLTGQLEVRYKNLVGVPTYILTTITLNNITVGDADTIFIDGFQEKTVAYDIELSEDDASNSPLVKFLSIYGETPDSLELLLEKNMTLSTIKILDDSSVNIMGIKYDKLRNVFVINVENTGETNAFVSVELIDLIVDAEKLTLVSDIEEIKAGQSKDIQIRQKLTDFDIEDNKIVKVRAYHGQREASLIKYVEKELELEIERLSAMLIAGAVIILLIIVFALLILFFRRKKKKKPRYSMPVPKPLR